MSWLAERGYEVSLVEVDGHGLVQPDALRAAIRPETRLVSIMMANNETGTVQPIEELAPDRPRRREPCSIPTRSRPRASSPSTSRRSAWIC